MHTPLMTLPTPHPVEDLPDLVRIPTERKALWHRTLLGLAGLLFLVLGVVGWLVPIITGIPAYIVGFVLLGAASPRVGRLVNRWERKLPRSIRLWFRPRLRRAEKARAKALAKGSGSDVEPQ